MYLGTLWFFTARKISFTQSGSALYERAPASLRADSCFSNMSAAYVHVNPCYTGNKLTSSFQWRVPVIFSFHINRKNKTPQEVYGLKSDKYLQYTQTWFPDSLLQYSSPAHMACIRQSRLGASTWYKEGKMTGKKRDENLPEQSTKWKLLSSTKTEFPSGCLPRVICFPGKVRTPVLRCEQCPCLPTAVPLPGSVWEPSGAYSSAPAALGSSSLASARHGTALRRLISSAHRLVQDRSVWHHPCPTWQCRSLLTTFSHRWTAMYYQSNVKEVNWYRGGSTSHVHERTALPDCAWEKQGPIPLNTFMLFLSNQNCLLKITGQRHFLLNPWKLEVNC